MTWLLTAASARRLRELTQTISVLEAEIAQLVPRPGS
jgi:type II secretory pathway component PulJ